MVTMVWVVSRFRFKGPSWYLIFIHIITHRDNVAVLHGLPTSEVGYTIAITRREDHEVHNRWWFRRGGMYSCEYTPALPPTKFFYRLDVRSRWIFITEYTYSDFIGINTGYCAWSLVVQQFIHSTRPSRPKLLKQPDVAHVFTADKSGRYCLTTVEWERI